MALGSEGIESGSALPDCRAAFERDGFFTLPGFATPSDLKRIQSEVDRYIREVVPGLSKEFVFCEQVSNLATLKQLQGMHEHDAFFADLIGRGPFRNVAEMVLGEEVVAKNLQFFRKPRERGLATPAHQDGHYFMLSPPHAVTLWFALDAMDANGACLRYVRGSHRDGLLEHRSSGVLGFSQGLVDAPPDHARREVAMAVRAGDLLGHHALTVHRANVHDRGEERRALGLIYYGTSAREDRMAYEAYQRSLYRKWREADRI